MRWCLIRFNHALVFHSTTACRVGGLGWAHGAPLAHFDCGDPNDDGGFGPVQRYGRTGVMIGRMCSMAGQAPCPLHWPPAWAV